MTSCWSLRDYVLANLAQSAIWAVVLVAGGVVLRVAWPFLRRRFMLSSSFPGTATHTIEPATGTAALLELIHERLDGQAGSLEAYSRSLDAFRMRLQHLEGTICDECKASVDYPADVAEAVRDCGGRVLCEECKPAPVGETPLA